MQENSVDSSTHFGVRYKRIVEFEGSVNGNFVVFLKTKILTEGKFWFSNFINNFVNWPTKNWSSKIVWKHLRQKIRAATLLEEIQLVPSPRIFPKSLEYPAWWKCWLFCLFGFFLEKFLPVDQKKKFNDNVSITKMITFYATNEIFFLWLNLHSSKYLMIWGVWTVICLHHGGSLTCPMLINVLFLFLFFIFHAKFTKLGP